LLTTDGVTEAGIDDESAEKQFGAERVTASAKASRNLGAHGIRTRIIRRCLPFLQRQLS
jgi:serine phosphatase RsbU (regulator of sigma subunit)